MHLWTLISVALLIFRDLLPKIKLLSLEFTLHMCITQYAVGVFCQTLVSYVFCAWEAEPRVERRRSSWIVTLITNVRISRHEVQWHHESNQQILTRVELNYVLSSDIHLWPWPLSCEQAKEPLVVTGPCRLRHACTRKKTPSMWMVTETASEPQDVSVGNPANGIQWYCFHKLIYCFRIRWPALSELELLTIIGWNWSSDLQPNYYSCLNERTDTVL
jgi:hypothetical protein